MTERAMGVTRACELVGISHSLFRYESRRSDDADLTDRMTAIAAQKRRYGYRRIHVLLRREGCLANHKRTWRLYNKAGWSVRKRKCKRIAAVERKPLRCRQTRTKAGRWILSLMGWLTASGFAA
ncbi:IS3 family transposase [Paraburkholderia diazotrophica]|uniref:IS3 family transposase n=1 Tax=Paraburkholderia diazotrophica TaxID=667676 RepID=UPI003180D852